MSRSRGKLHKAQCCPWCGTRTLVRDGFVSEDHKSYSQVSYICSICFAGFSIRDSPRAQFAQRMYAIERQQRAPNDEHIQKPGKPPLTARSLYELTRIEELLRAKKPHSKESKAANALQLINVRAELARRGVKPGALTFQIGEVYPTGSLTVN